VPSETKGFVEDSHLDLKARNYYYNRNKKSDGVDDKDWTQGFWGIYSSGYA
jgi:imipenem/basic amino acid-specific outer membrane pore